MERAEGKEEIESGREGKGGSKRCRKGDGVNKWSIIFVMPKVQKKQGKLHWTVIKGSQWGEIEKKMERDRGRTDKMVCRGKE